MRTFLAIDIDDAARKALLAAGRELMPAAGKARLAAPENVHVTMHFMGDLSEDEMADVCDVTAEVASQHEPFDFDLRGIAVVPRTGNRIRMLWGEVADGSGAMTAVHADLGKALAGLGLHVEDRRFHPHITLVRVRFCPDAAALRTAAAAFAETPFGTCRAEHVTVYTSDLTGRSPVYTPAARCGLGSDSFPNTGERAEGTQGFSRGREPPE